MIRGLKKKAGNISSETKKTDFTYESVRPNKHFYTENFDSFNERHKEFDFKVFRKAYNKEEFEGFGGNFNKPQ